MTMIARCVALLLVHGAVGSKRWTPPMLSFDFQASKCQNETFMNLGLLDGASLRRDPSATLFSKGNLGLETIPVLVPPQDDKLFGSTESLLEYLQDSNESTSDGISISLWLRSLQQDNDDMRSPIWTVQRATSSAIQDGITECDRQKIDLQLGLHNRTLTLLFRTSDSFFEPCQTMSFRNLGLDGLTHVALVLTHKHQQIYVNGQSGPYMTEPFDPLLSHWSRWGIFQFFSFPDQKSWHGQLYRFEVFGQVWDQAHVAAIMSRGIPPSHPYTSDFTFRMYEDAEVVPESHSTEWYEQSNLVSGQAVYNDDEVPKVSLPISFLDEELISLLEFRNISHAKAPEVLVYITKMPVLGKIYLVDGSTLDSKHHFVAMRQREIVFIPDLNTYSALPGSTYATMEYCVSLHEIFTSSQCLSTSTIRVIVDPVNDPPMAIIGQKEPYRVREGLKEALTPLRLQGFDVDQGDAITTFEIVSPPQFGHLFLSVPIRRGDDLHHGTLLSEMGYQISGSEALVEYRFNSSNTIVRDLVVMDSFNFRVRDTHGSWSSPVRVMIQVISSLTGDLMDPFVVQEGSLGIVPLGMEDQSGLNRSIGVFIETVPRERGAFLFDQGLKAIIPPGTFVDEGFIHSPYVGKSGIGFGSSAKLCVAEKTVNSSFGYRVVAYGSNGRICSVSDIAERNVTVQCKVKPIQVAIPQDNFTTRAFNSPMDDACSGYNYHKEMEGGAQVLCESIVILEDIHVTSDPTHTDRALVNITCTHGRLTLNPQHREQLRLLEDQGVMRPSISFLSLLSDLDNILAHLHYQSDVEGEDEVRISIHYGNCDDRMAKKDAFQCASTEQSIRIEVLPPLPIKQNILFDSFPWMPLPFTLTLLLLMKFKGKFRMVLAMNTSNATTDDEKTVASTVSVRWQQYYDDNTGFFYYLDLLNGCVTWSPPLEEDFIPCQEKRELP